MGDGRKNEFLSEITAKYPGKNIYPDPSEATAIGYLTVQMTVDKKIKILNKVKEPIKQSFEITEEKS